MARNATDISPLRIADGPRLVRAKYTALLLLGIAGVVYHLWFARTYGIEMDKHMIFHLGIMMVGVAIVAFDPYALDTDELRTRVDSFVLLPIEIVAAIGVTGYLWTNYERLAFRAIGIYSQTDVLVGGILILLVLDLSRRAFGLVLPAVGIVGLIYAVYGNYFPGILQHQGITFQRVLTATTVEFSGIFDTIVKVSATYIVIFIIFAAFLESYGALAYFIKIGASAGRYIRSGITQTAVISSLGMGSVNGSAAANSATTGAFTIPLLKSQGTDRNTAAAIESVASSGGQIMPPIMGAAAFIMAEITGTGYLHIIKIGFIPALLFYGTVAFAVHMLTLKEGAELANLEENIDSAKSEFDEDERTTVDDVSFGDTNSKADLLEETTASDSFIHTVLQGLYLWVPVGVLVYTLVILQFDPLYAGFWATLITIPTALVQELLLGDDPRSAVRTFIGDTLDACRLGIQNTAPIALAAAVMGLFVGVLSLTGFTQTLAQSLITISGGELFLLLFFAMCAAILFGMGMPTVAAYIVSVLLVAPPLAQMGVRLETAHFFVFYFAILSAITPPVAIACIITTEISNGDFWQVCKKSILLGAPLFILPYIFLVNNELLYWTFPSTFILVPIVFLGMISLSAALIRYMNGSLTRTVQLGLILCSFVVLFAPVLPVASSITLAVRSIFAVALLGFIVWRNGIATHVRSLAGRLA